MKFRKKPVVIEAIQWTGSNQLELMRWAGAGSTRTEWEFDGPRMAIETLEGRMLASVGDWIIEGVHGEFYPCKPDIFAATYEAVDE